MDQRQRALLPPGHVLVERAGIRPGLEPIDNWLTTGDLVHGYLQVERPDFDDLLLLYGGQVHCAVRMFVEGPPRVVPLKEFVEDLESREALGYRVCKTDAGLALLLGIVAQNFPTAIVPSKWSRPERILKILSVQQATVVVELRRGDERNFAYIKGGRVVGAYFAKAVFLPNSPPRVQLESYGDTDDATTIVYTKLSSQRDPLAGMSLEAIRKSTDLAPPFNLIVRRGTEVMTRRQFRTGRATLGRDPSNDIVIDHETISREHCLIEWEHNRLMIRDQGSANGVWVEGKQVTQAMLVRNSKVEVGDFTVEYPKGEDTGPSTLETVFLAPSASADAALILGKDTYPLNMPVFTIGAEKDAGMQVKGFRVQPVQATVVRESGNFRILPAPQGRAVTCNGEDVPESGVVLNEGDEVKIGRNTITFTRQQTTSGLGLP